MVGPEMAIPLITPLAYWQTYRRKLSPAYVAAVMDRAWGLDEQLATAGELAFSERADCPAAQACFTQVAAQIAGRDPATTRIRQDAIARLGALAGLLVLACVVTMIWSAVRTGRLGGDADPRSAAEYAAMAEELAVTLRADELPPRLRARFEQMLLAAWEMDEDALQAQLAELRRQGYTIIEFDAASLLATAGVSRETIDELVPPDVPAPAEGSGEGAGPLPDERVRVYAPGREDSAHNLPPDEAEAFFDDAWSAARRRAATQVHSGTVPAEYQGIVRAYFDLAD